MEEIKPKKERKFLKAMGDIVKVLANELVMGIARKFIGKAIDKVGNKRQGLVIAFLLVAGISYASIDSIPYPVTGNKQRLGWQTSGNGLVYRGRSNDTITKPSSYVDKNVKAYLLLDSVRGTIFVWRQTYWDSIKVNTRLMPFDSITFNTAKNGTVGVGEVEYNDTQGSLIQGLKGGNVTNVIGQQLHQRVNNRTGAPLAKGDVVYLAGSQGNRITVAKGLAVTDAFSANTFGVVAESIADNASGFIITEGLITGLNTSALTEDSAVYLSPTVAGALTSTKPQAPQHSVYIGVCVKSNNGSGELFVKIRNGLEMDELHDTRITNPVTGATLYYSGGLWRDTTAALLVSDTASMLTNYLRTGTAASTYLTQSNAASTYLPLTGGTLSSFSNDNNFTDTILNINYSPPSFATNQNISGLAININNRGYTNIGITSEASTILNTAIGVKGRATQSDINGTGIAYGIVGEVAAGGSGSNGSTYAGYFNNTSTVGGNHYGLFVNTASGGDYGIYQTGSGTNYFGSNTSIGGTLGVTGATTLSAPLTVNSSAVFNEGSTDSDFRVESDGNAHMVFVDASTDRVGIGYASPTKTLDVNGEVRINTLTATPTTLLGKDGSNVVGNVRLTSPLSLAGDSLNLGTVPISKGGTGADNASLARTLLSVSYNFVQVTAGSSVTITSNRVSVVNTGGFSTTQLDLTPATNGRMYMIKNLASGTVVSLHSNVIPLTGGSPTTAILSAGNATPQWVTLVADGTNWHVMQSN